MCNFVYFCVLMWYFAAFWRNKRWLFNKRGILLLSLRRWLGKLVKCPSVRCQHIQNPKTSTSRPPSRGRWNLARIFYGSRDITFRKRNFEFRPLRLAGSPSAQLSRDRWPNPSGVLVNFRIGSCFWLLPWTLSPWSCRWTRKAGPLLWPRICDSSS